MFTNEHVRLVVAAATVALLMNLPATAWAAGEPDALAVKWEGKKPCENLYEDDKIRVIRCTFPPGSKHVRHSHPAHFGYALAAGKISVASAKGTEEFEETPGLYWKGGPIEWHEATNIGDTTLQYLVVEKKY